MLVYKNIAIYMDLPYKLVLTNRSDKIIKNVHY